MEKVADRRGIPLRLLINEETGAEKANSVGSLQRTVSIGDFH